MIRRTFSLPVFIISLVAVAAGAATFHYVRGWQLSRLASSFLSQSRLAERNEKWQAAAAELDRYLRLQPNDHAMRVRQAVVFAKGATTLPAKHQAVGLHYRALAIQAAEKDVSLRLGLAELLLETGRLLEAEGEAQRVLEHSPDHSKALRVFALSRHFQWRSGALSSQRPAELRLLESIEKALASNPQDIALVEIAATLYRDFPDVVAVHRAGLNQHSREAHADGLLDHLVAARRNDAKAHLSRHMYRARYHLAGARDDLDRALALAPHDPQIVLLAAAADYELGRAGDSEMNRQHRDQAAQLYRKVIEKDLAPDNVEPHLWLGEIHATNGDLAKGLGLWRAALAKFPRPTDQLACQARIADHLLRAGRLSEAKAALDAADQILATLGGVIPRDRHLALMQAQGLRRATYHLVQGRFADAVGEAQNAIARQPQLQPDSATSHFAWDILGRGFVGLEDWTAAATAFDRAANFQPKGATSRLAAAHAWLCAGRADLAVDRAEQIVLIEGLPEAWIILGTGELQIQSTTAPVDRSWTRVAAALDALAQIEPSQIAAPWRVDFLRANYVALRTPTTGEPAFGPQAAADVLRQAETKFASDGPFWFEACLAFERLGYAEDAERAWQRLNQLPGKRTEAAIAASRRATLHSDYRHATEILEAAVKSSEPAMLVRLRSESIRVARAQQDLPRMRQLLVSELNERPRDVSVLCQLAELDLRAENMDGLKGWEQELESAGQLGELWSRYFRIVRLYTSASGPDDPALREALAEQAQLATLRPNWAESFALRGAIEQRLERLEAAVVAYEQAVALGERRYAVFEQLIACLDKLHRTDDVEKYLARLETYLPASQRLTEIATQRQLDTDRPERAVDLARRAVSDRPTDLRAKLWLGRLLLLTNRLSEAGDVFEKATQSAPQDVRSWNGLFTFYLRTGQKDKARQVVNSIRQHARLDPVELDLVVGQAYLRLGENAQAVRLFAALRDQAPDRADVHLQLARIYLETDREKAKEYLHKAVTLDPSLSQARWLLAAILAAGGSEAELAEAEQLLGSHSLADAPATLGDRRVRALLLAQHGDAEGLARAVKILEQIISEGADITNDRLLLAAFYERQAGATPDETEMAAKLAASRDQLVNVASRGQAQTSEVALLVGFLIRQEEPTEAAVWLDRLEERVRSQSHSDPRAIANLIDLRLAHGTVKESVAWIERLEAIDSDPIRPLGARVKYLAKTGKADEVEKLVEARAQAALAAAIEAPERARLARAIGDIYLTTGLLEPAERWYRIVVREDREQFPVLALTLIRQGRAREAISICQAATEHDSTSRPAVVLASILLEVGGKPEHLKLAAGLLDAALARFPDDPQLLYGMGMLRILGDRYPEAITLLRKVLAHNPRHVPALNNLAVLVAESPDEREQALDLAQQAIVLRGEQPTLLDTKGTILVFGGKSSEAINLLEAAARGVHSDPRHKFHLAMAYHDIGSNEQARQLLSAALKQNLEKQILTPTDRKSLARLQASLQISTSQSR